MRLYHSPTSPFVRKVMILIHEAGLQDRVQVVPVTGNAVAPGSLPVDHNPLGKIPTLELPDGRVLYDSRVICRYLDSVAKSGLYPGDTGPHAALWDVLVIEAAADGIMEAAALVTYEARLRPPELQFAPWIDGQWAKVIRALDALERDRIAHLTGPLGMAQIAVAAALGYLDFRHPTRPWRARCPALAAWHDGFATRPALRATLPQG